MQHMRTNYKDIDKILYSAEQIKAAVKTMGQQITNDYQGKQPLLVCVMKGASIFFADLIREIDLPVTLDSISVTSYGASTSSNGEIRLVKDLDSLTNGKDIIIVEDIVDTGHTLFYLKKLLEHRGAASIKIAALMNKPSRRVVPLDADYYCFEVPNEFVVGYGLDYNQVYRNLPDICVLSPDIYQK